MVAQVLLSFDQHTKFEMPCFSRSKGIIRVPKTSLTSCDQDLS